MAETPTSEFVPFEELSTEDLRLLLRQTALWVVLGAVCLIVAGVMPAGLILLDLVRLCLTGLGLFIAVPRAWQYNGIREVLANRGTLPPAHPESDPAKSD